jgi:DNA-binding transcriptional MerR regulator
MYRTNDLDMIVRIKTLLYDKGFTIKGARRRIRLERRKQLEERQLALGVENPWSDGLTKVRDELAEILQKLKPKGHQRRG